jgi:hydroxymethylbilane synthase
VSKELRTLAVGTRGSPLAMAQTHGVIARVRERYPEIECTIRRITTKGDIMHDVPLAAIGGRGVFADAIEDALREREIDFAVHSAKDLPTVTPKGLTIAALLEREDPRDVLISRTGGLHELAAGAKVGTSSQRRACQLLAARPDLEIRDLRGNVGTRLRKLEAHEYDAIVLAGAGLIRLGLTNRVTEWLPTTAMLPAPGQGALAIEVRTADRALRAMLEALADRNTTVALQAERGFLAHLGAGCAGALAALANVTTDGVITLEAMIGAPDGRLVRGSRSAPAGQGAELGPLLAEELLARGGRELIPEMRPAVS